MQYKTFFLIFSSIIFPSSFIQYQYVCHLLLDWATNVYVIIFVTGDDDDDNVNDGDGEYYVYIVAKSKEEGKNGGATQKQQRKNHNCHQ